MKLGAASVAWFFYLVFLTTMFLGFTGHISRVTLGRDLTPATGGLDTLIFRAARERELQQRLDSNAEEIFGAQGKLSTLNAQTLKYEYEYDLQAQRLQETFLPIIQRLSSGPDIMAPAFVDQVRATYLMSYDSEYRKANDLAALLAVPVFLPAATSDDLRTFATEIAAVLKDLNERRASLSQANADWEKSKREENSLIDTIGERRKQNEGLQVQFDMLSAGLTDANRAVIASFESLGGVPYAVLKIPTVILTLLVTVAAGGLGSTVAFTRKFFVANAGNVSVAHLLVNAAEGVAAAVAIFFLAGSGMLMLAQGVEGANGDLELSPYLIACIAFVSGFMAEDAFARIQLAGKNLFGGGAPPPVVPAATAAAAGEPLGLPPAPAAVAQPGK